MMIEERIFQQAIGIGSPQERNAFLDRECGGDAALKEGVERLLRLHSDAGSFLERPPSAVASEQTVRMTGDTSESASRTPGDRTEFAASADTALDFLVPTDKVGCLGTIGPYEVLSVVGRGGMGIVLKALDTRLNRTVAVKVLAPELATNAVARKRFVREAQAAAAVVHPHVVTIHAVDEDRVPYLVMEYVHGQSVRDKVEQVGTLGVREILRIGSQIAAGLAAAHKQGLIHRDIKPANILLENGIERVKITDFGLARAVDDLSVTRTGEVAGTPQYMSPEQAQAERVDHRSDLFSLGSVLYTLCSGRPPFRGDNPIAVVRRVVDDTPRRLLEINSEIPEWLCDVIAKLLEKNPEDRFQSATEVAALLEQHLARLQLAPTPPQMVATRSAEPMQDHRGSRGTFGKLIAGAGGLAAILLLAGILIKVTSRDGTVTTIEVDDAAEIQIQRRSDEVPKLPVGAAFSSYSGTLHPYRDQIGKTLYFDITGNRDGSVWGSDVYSDDSSLSAAAVHAGVLNVGERKAVAVTILPGRSSYMAATRNGVSSVAWSTHGGSFRFGESTDSSVAAGEPDILDLDHVLGFRDQVGKTLRVRTVGRVDRICYGDGVYSDDSDIGTAAVHAGLLRKDEAGVIQVTILPGQSRYAGSERHNVSSLSYGTWGGSFRLKAFEGSVPATPEPEAERHLPQSVIPDARYVTMMRGQTGRIFHVSVTGASDGFVFGTDVYSGDSSVAAAAVHAGVLRAGEKAVVAVTLLAGQTSYSGSTRNGVTSVSWGAWPVSFRIERAKGAFLDPLSSYRGKAGTSFVVRVVGNAGGPCWGTEIYSDDSDISCAAVHAGLIRDGERGIVRITLLDGRASYAGSTRHGVTSLPFGEWKGSFRLERAATRGRRDNAGESLKAPPVAVAPFDAALARVHQEAWAKHLGVLVEYTNSIGVRFRLIPPGEFLMGSTRAEIDDALKFVPADGPHWQECVRSESPQHRVILTRPFYLGTTEMTQRAYSEIVGSNPSAFAATGSDKDRAALVAGLDTSTHPVESVNWREAAAFCIALSRKEGLSPSYVSLGDLIATQPGNGYRLPSEAEWEYACRAGTTTRFWTGDSDDSLPPAGWMGASSGQRTHAVGELKANPFGLFDTHGNVWEWVEDGWDAAYFGQFADKAAVDPRGPAAASPLRVFRGGSLYDSGSLSRSSHRYANNPETRSFHVGFRIVLPTEAVHPASE